MRGAKSIMYRLDLRYRPKSCCVCAYAGPFDVGFHMTLPLLEDSHTHRLLDLASDTPFYRL